MCGRHSTKSDKRLLGFAQVPVALMNNRPLADNLGSRCGTHDQGAFGEFLLCDPGGHQCDAEAKLGELLHDLETWNLHIRGQADAAAKKEILRPAEGYTVAAIKQEVLLLQIGCGDGLLLRPRMQ